uniref:Cwf18 pre-mRNA splicing factor n=1 Tax=Anopheles atroparvus TaxID=41427 RepID=A0AAG5CN65_ANOAO
MQDNVSVYFYRPTDTEVVRLFYLILQMNETVGKLEEEALRRKERLRQLARKSANQNEETSCENGGAREFSDIPKNYQPECTILNEGSIEAAGVGDVQTEITAQLEMMKTPIIIEDIDIVNLAPRKPDWDLKRDVSKKLEKLERRTQKAIAELIRERLKEGQSQDILQAVNVASSAASIARNVVDQTDGD